MPVEFVRADMAGLAVDAVANMANRSLPGGGCVDGAIHRAAGPDLLAECRGLSGCEPGQAKLTGAYCLPARFAIHSVAPIWRGGEAGEAGLLERCYESCLAVAGAAGCESNAFPAISSGASGFPHDLAAGIAIAATADSEFEIKLVALDAKTERHLRTAQRKRAKTNV